jgi:hypothetical protein
MTIANIVMSAVRDAIGKAHRLVRPQKVIVAIRVSIAAIARISAASAGRRRVVNGRRRPQARRRKPRAGLERSATIGGNSMAVAATRAAKAVLTSVIPINAILISVMAVEQGTTAHQGSVRNAIGRSIPIRRSRSSPR